MSRLFGSSPVSSSPDTASVEARPLTRKKLRSLNFSLSPRGPRNSPRASGHRGGTPRRLSLGRHKHSPVIMANEDASPLLHWMERGDCPMDIVPHMLAFAGPQAMAAMSRASTHWRNIVMDETTWRIVCEDLYKWKEGDDLPKTTWREFYRMNPCVPVDYSTLPVAVAAFSTPTSNRNEPLEQRSSVRILLRPATYVLREALSIDAIGDSTRITIQTMKLPFQNAHREIADKPLPKPSLSPTKRLKKKAASIRNRLSCRTMDVESVVSSEHLEETHETNGQIVEFPVPEAALLPEGSLNDESTETIEPPTPPPPSRATIVLRTRRQNEPVIRVRQGKVKMEELHIIHSSHGMDIWNGNSAIQIQPPTAADGRPIPAMTRPMVELDHVEITSRSGRGIVNIDGGDATIRHCYVHDCAATGVYVGGQGTTMTIENSDVLRNGMGNKWSRRGIARGHSGIYLEQGRASIVDCNISLNSLTGISAISDSNAILCLESCDLVANGTQQLEMPPDGSVARRMSLTRNNNLAVSGLVRTRSGLVVSEDESCEEEE